MKLLSNTTNAAVIHADGRRFPGVLIQGDSLKNLQNLTKNCQLNLANNINESEEILIEMFEILEGYLKNYETVLKKNDIELPYPPS